MTKNDLPSDRRDFLLRMGMAGLGSLGAADASAIDESCAGTGAAAGAQIPYLSLGPEEAAFVEALVEIMCPADEWSPGGVDCGLATYIDRQLAGPYGKAADRYQRGPFRQGKPQMGLQLPLTPEQFFKAAIAQVNAICLRERGATFDQLSAADGGAMLEAIAGGSVSSEDLPLAAWFNELLYPLFIEACFADPVYGGNRAAVFWRMLGYPGLPATYTLDMVRYRGKAHPGARSPKSMGDFT
jgi:gluconate 2-dehydrogenase gamma chain